MTTGARITSTAAFAEVRRAMALLPKLIDDRMLDELRRFEPLLLARMRGSVPVRISGPPSPYDKFRHPGGLRSLLSTHIDADALRLSGGLLTHQARSDGFYGYILDAGRGLLRSRSRPRTRYRGSKHIRLAGATGTFDAYTVRYSRRISPIAPTRYDITFGRTRTWAQEAIGPILDRIYQRARDVWLS